MKLFLCGLLMFASLLYGSAAAKDKPTNELTLMIVEVSPSGSITVRISNLSKRTIRLWKESNGCGAAHRRVLLIREGRLQTFYQSPDQVFTRSIPTFSEIAGGAHIEHKLNLNETEWHGSEGKKISFKSGDTIIVIYDVPRAYGGDFGWAGTHGTVDPSKMDVWYGVTSALMTIQ